MLVPFFFPDKSINLLAYRNQFIITGPSSFDKILALAAMNFISVGHLCNYTIPTGAFQNYWTNLYLKLTGSYLQRTFLFSQVRLRLVGSGFFAQKETEQTILLHLGFSHTVEISVKPPLFVKVEGRKQKLLHCWSGDSDLLASFVWTLRNLKQPDCYKGKGVRYVKESMRLKKGKKKFV